MLTTVESSQDLNIKNVQSRRISWEEALSVEDLKQLRKVELRAVIDHLAIRVPRTARKDELVGVISARLNLKVEPDKAPVLSFREQFELDKLRLEHEEKLKREQLEHEKN